MTTGTRTAGASRRANAIATAVPVRGGQGHLRALHAVGAGIAAAAAPPSLPADLAHAARLTTLGELTASIAHEVNQPLAAIVTNCESCLRWLDRDEPQIERARASLAAVIRNALRSSEIIQSLRALSRKGETDKTILDLNDVIADVLSFVRPEMARTRVALRLELAPGLPRVLGDRVQLQQVALNLLLNAVQAMAAVSGRARELVVQSHHDTDCGMVGVKVRDNGPGIPVPDPDLLFTPFYTTKRDGMGIGLSICRSIVEAHEGRIWASRNSMHGATFHLALPAAREAAM